MDLGLTTSLGVTAGVGTIIATNSKGGNNNGSSSFGNIGSSVGSSAMVSTTTTTTESTLAGDIYADDLVKTQISRDYVEQMSDEELTNALIQLGDIEAFAEFDEENIKLR